MNVHNNKFPNIIKVFENVFNFKIVRLFELAKFLVYQWQGNCNCF